jgi:periplasmic protein TonB
VKPQGPIQLPENATAPVALSNPQPSYPEQARGAGVEATVVVKFVVTEAGDVTNVVIVRGHPLFDEAVLSAIRSWRYKPALFEGRPIPVYRVVRIPFKIKT